MLIKEQAATHTQIAHWWCPVKTGTPYRHTWAPGMLAGMPPQLNFLAQHHERDISPQFGDTQPAGVWTAGQRTHPVWLRYDTRSQVATVETQGTSVEIRLKSHMGLLVEPWDLHVGALVDVCGRNMTLAGTDHTVRAIAVLRAPVQRGVHDLPAMHAQSEHGAACCTYATDLPTATAVQPGSC